MGNRNIQAKRRGSILQRWRVFGFADQGERARFPAAAVAALVNSVKELSYKPAGGRISSF